MGRSVNGCSIRLGNVFDWYNSYNSVQNKSIDFLSKDLKIVEYIESFLNQKDYKGILLSHVYVKHTINNIRCEIYIYEDVFSIEKVEDNFFNDLREKLLISIYLPLKKELKRLLKREVEIEFYILDEKTITSNFLSKYICIKLEEGRQLADVLKNISFIINKNITENQGIVGCKIKCTGRFGRKQRASAESLNLGVLPLGNLNNYIDYSQNFAVLRYGKSNIKVWLLKKVDIAPYKLKIKIIEENVVRA